MPKFKKGCESIAHAIEIFKATQDHLAGWVEANCECDDTHKKWNSECFLCSHQAAIEYLEKLCD